MSDTELRDEIAALRKSVEELTRTLAGFRNQGALGGGFRVDHYHHGQQPAYHPQWPHYTHPFPTSYGNNQAAQRPSPQDPYAARNNAQDSVERNHSNRDWRS